MLTNAKRSVILDSAALQKFIVARAIESVSTIPQAKLKVILCVADRDLRNERMRKRPSQITTIHVDPATIVDYFQIFSHLPEDAFILYTNRSFFKRTRQTAGPTLSLFPSVLREVWPVHEFTYLGQQHDILSSIYERRPIVQDYWRQCKPSAGDSADSESFVSFMKRIKQVHFQLRETNFKTIAIFSHEQFICAFLWCLQRSWRNMTQDDMKDYREFLDAHHIPNGGIVRIQLDENYRIKEYQMITSHLDTSLLGSCLEHSVTNDEIEMQI